MVIRIVAAALNDPGPLIERLGLRNASAAHARRVIDRAAGLAKSVVENSSEGRRELVCDLVQQVVIGDSEISVALRKQPLLTPASAHSDGSREDPMLFSAPVAFRRRGIELKLVLPAAVESHKPRQLDVGLVKAVARAWLWYEQLIAGQMESLEAIADREGFSPGYPGRLLRLAFLAPDILEAILQGRQSADLSLSRLTRQLDLPFEWASQRELLRA